MLKLVSKEERVNEDTTTYHKVVNKGGINSRDDEEVVGFSNGRGHC